MNLFIFIAIVLTAVAVALVVVPLLRAGNEDNSAPLATVLAVALPALVLLAYMTASNYDWINPPGVEQAVAGEMSDAIVELESRLQREPENVEGWLLLGRSYAQLGQQPEARAAYVRALDLQVSSEALLGVAEADIMQDRNSVVGPAGQLVEQALNLEPENPKALFYGGMVAMARNEPDVVRARWGRLLELSPPPNLKKILEEQLAMLPGAPVAQPSVTLSEEGSGTISVDITLSPALSEKIKPGAMLFLVARDPARPGPPVAAVRKSVVTLPATIKISDSDAMLPGRSISGLSSVTLVARIANSGDPIAKPGDLFGETAYQNDGANPSSAITIDKIVE